MALQSIYVKPVATGGRRTSGSGVLVTINSRGGNQSDALAIRFSSDAMKAMRWTTGDTIDIQCDPDDLTLHVRRINGTGRGWNLTAVNGTGPAARVQLSAKYVHPAVLKAVKDAGKHPDDRAWADIDGSLVIDLTRTLT